MQKSRFLRKLKEPTFICVITDFVTRFMVDYSKWDKFVSELSDEDDSAGPVQVHHIEDGGTVTIGPDGPCIDSLQSSNSNLANTVMNGLLLMCPALITALFDVLSATETATCCH